MLALPNNQVAILLNNATLLILRKNFFELVKESSTQPSSTSIAAVKIELPVLELASTAHHGSYRWCLT